MIYTHSIILKKSGETGVYMTQIDSEQSLLEDVVTLIEQQQRKKLIPVGYNLISITCVDVREGSLEGED